MLPLVYVIKAIGLTEVMIHSSQAECLGEAL
jgi:hypothetical protein